MNKEWLVKTLALGIVALFICVTVTPSIGISNYPDDTTPPITTISTDPEPVAGGWYPCGVEMTLNATDNESGVNVTYYKINENGWMIYIQPFFLCECGINIFQFYSVDNAGNVEETKQTEIKIDCYPPILYISFDPPEPDGENGWYVSNITVILNATDDMSGVKEIRYIYHGFHTIPGDNGTFIIAEDGDVPFECWAIDNVDNEEIPHHICVVTNIDRNAPEIDLTFEVTGGNPIIGYDLTFTATATDELSGMNKVEFYLNNYTNSSLQKTIIGPGPTYQWMYHLSSFSGLNIIGLIINPEITNDYVKFFAVFVLVMGFVNQSLPFWVSAYAYDNAGNYAFYETENPTPKSSLSPGVYIFKNLMLPNDYKGDIGEFFIKASFYL
jgi:hypothetical protein